MSVLFLFLYMAGCTMKLGICLTLVARSVSFAVPPAGTPAAAAATLGNLLLKAGEGMQAPTSTTAPRTTTLQALILKLSSDDKEKAIEASRILSEAAQPPPAASSPSGSVQLTGKVAPLALVDHFSPSLCRRR